MAVKDLRAGEGVEDKQLEVPVAQLGDIVAYIAAVKAAAAAAAQ